MKKCLGITESIWANLSEDQRFTWKFASRFAAAIGAYFVVKTGIDWFDWTLGTITGLFLLNFIESQRSYSKQTPVRRKRKVRVAIFLGSWGIAIFGIAYFPQVALSATAPIFSREVLPALKQSTSVYFQLVVMVSFTAALFVAIFRTFRNLQVEELIYHLPRRGLKKLLVMRQHKATDFWQFALIELLALAVCLVYASSVAEIVQIYLQLMSIVP